MKKHLFKFALTLFVCMLSNAALANGDSNIILSEDFTNFETPHTWSSNSCEINYWKVLRCDSKSFENISDNFALLINCSSKTNPVYVGYAITPEIGYSGDVILSLKYGNSSNDHAKMRITILTSGTFQDGKTTKDVTIDRKFVDDNGPLSDDINIIGVKSDTKIKFDFVPPANKTYNYYYIDDVSITKDGMTLDESIDNTPWITGNNNKAITVKTVRTLIADKWNTLCLPFDVNKQLLEGALGTDKKIELRTYSIYDATNKVMNFEVADNATIEAGTPFLIKLNATVENPTFTGVTIKDVAAKTIESNGVSFVGTYSPVELNTDGTHIFITTDNKIAKPLEGKNEMKGLRAYITVPSDFDFNAARLFLDDEATFINSIGTPKATNNATLYNLQGQRVERPRSGLYIKNNKLTIIR